MIREGQKTATSALENFYQEMKETIAHSKFFITSERPTQVGLAKLCSATEINRKCGDSVTVEVFVPKLHGLADSSGFSAIYPTLLYSGTFCTVCHFSAELLCQNYQDLMHTWPAEQVNKTTSVFSGAELECSLRQAIHVFTSLEPSLQQARPETTNPALEKLHSLNLALEKMPSRKACALLPWRAALKLSDTLIKHRNVPK